MTRLGFHVRVGSLLTGTFVALTAILVLLLGLQLTRDLHDMSAAGRLVTLADADRTVFNTMQVLRNSRGDVQTALLNLDDPQSKLSELKERAVAKLNEAAGVLPRIGGSVLDTLVVDLRTRWSEATQKWDALGTVAAKPRAGRSVGDTDVWYKAMSGVLENLNDASLNVAAEARIADPYVAELVGVRQVAWSIREAAGTECSAMRATIASNESLSAKHAGTIGRVRGAGEAGWTALKGQMVRPGMPRQLVDAVATAERDFTGSIAKRDEVYGNLGNGAASVTPAQWTTLCNAPFESILAVALKALDLMQQRAEAQYVAARLALIVTIGATLLALSGAALILRSIRRRVIQPVKALNDAIGHLSRHEYATAVPQVGHDDEFSAMAETLESLRQGTIQSVQQAAESINSVAGASEEMRASLAEVSTKVEQSSKLSAHAVSDAAATNREVARLAGAAAEIGQVVGVISAIAAQTNLLALNATIEAARAGEAGRGFAVVAGEVKSLAAQTATATHQITLQVSAIQGATDSAVLAMDAIGARIREVDGLTGAITQAVQGQVSAMNQVSRDSQEVALLTDRVSMQLTEVRTAAAGTVTAAGQVRQTTDELGRQSGLLSREIERFIAGVG